MDSQTIQSAITTYLAEVRKHIRIDRAVLFGSVAQARATSESDVDVIILSEDFKNLDPDDREKLLYRASVGFPYDLHVSGFTPEEFASASPLTSLGQIKQSTKTTVIN